MIIKRWNGSAFVEEFPKTKAQLIYNNANNATIFDSNDKIKVAYLPDSVFDSLYFLTSATTATQYDPQGSDALLRDMAHYAHTNVGSRNVVGAYFVATETIVLDANSTGALSGYGGGLYWITRFTSTDEGGLGTAGSMGSADTTTLETGDWIVITARTGAGTVGDPYIVTFAVVENTYELATTAVDGIVRLSSRTTYASLSGNNVINESTLKTVIDNAAFASGTHVHGNISNGGQITATVVTPADTDTILIADASNSGKVERGITIGTGTSTYLRNDGTWGTPVGTTYSQATTSTLGLVKLGATAATATVNTATTTAGRFYHVTAQTSGEMYVNVPWTDTNTTYTAGTGLALVGTVFQHSDTSTAATLTANGRTYVTGLTFDTFGHVTGYTTGTETVVDTNTTYSAGEGITLSSTTFRMTYPLYVQTATPTTSVTGTIWYDIN